MRPPGESVLWVKGLFYVAGVLLGFMVHSSTRFTSTSHPPTPKDSPREIVVQCGDLAKVKLNLLKNNTAFATCHCDPPVRTEEELLNYRAGLAERAIHCVDEFKGQRMGIPIKMGVVSRCAYNWILDHMDKQFNVQKPSSVFDYGFDSMDYPFANRVPANWTFFLSLLPQDTIAMPVRKGIPKNAILLAPPTLPRLRSLFVTSSFFDIQLALRLDEMSIYATPMELYQLVANIIASGKVTYLLMPCWGYDDQFDSDIVVKGIRRALRQRKQFGIQYIDLRIESAAVFRYETCTKELLKVTIAKLYKGVRRKWCYYQEGWKRSLLYSKGQPLHVVLHDDDGTPVSVHKVYNDTYINLADIMSFGMTKSQRDAMFYEMLTHPPTNALGAHNWMIGPGAVLQHQPIIGDIPIRQDNIPKGRHYIELLRIQMCTFEQAKNLKWRRSGQMNTLQYSTKSDDWRVSKGVVWKRSEAGWAVQRFQHAKGNPDFTFCPACVACVMWEWDFEKGAFPPEDCHNCSRCQRKGLWAMELAQPFYGCHDVEGVTDNGERIEPRMCDDTQVGVFEPNLEDIKDLLVKEKQLKEQAEKEKEAIINQTQPS